MKKLVLIAFVLLSISSNAQIFAPQGAQWIYYQYHNVAGPYGSVTYKYVGDTLINSITCQKIIVLGDPYDIYYFYSDADAIYSYNQGYNLFNKIFDYNLNIGDSLEVYSTNIPCENQLGQSYYTHITGKGTDIINGQSYRYLDYDYPNGQFLYFEGRYYEKLGFLNNFFTIQPDGCVPDGLVVECLMQYTEDTTATPAYESQACISLTTVDEIDANKFSIYPNPVTNGRFTIKSQQLVKQVQLINALGQTVLSTTGNEVNVSALPQGMYIVKITFANNLQGIKKIMVE